MIKYVKKGPDKKGRTFILEGKELPDNVFSVTRFICEVQKQENEEKTQEVANLLLQKLNS